MPKMKMNRTGFYEFRITVEGKGRFPFDMLRYDRCTPAAESESSKLDDCDDKRQVQLIQRAASNQGPTSRRWQSFGWEVVKVEPLS